MVQKMSSFFFHDLQLIRVLLSICDSYLSWSTRFVSLILCVGLSIFDSVWFLLKFIFLFNKMHLTLKRHNYFQNLNNRKVSHSFAPRPLIFKLQQKVLKFDDMELPKNWPGDKFFKLRKWKFWERQFFFQ